MSPQSLMAKTLLTLRKSFFPPPNSRSLHATTRRSPRPMTDRWTPNGYFWRQSAGDQNFVFPSGRGDGGWRIRYQYRLTFPGPLSVLQKHPRPQVFLQTPSPLDHFHSTSDIETCLNHVFMRNINHSEPSFSTLLNWSIRAVVTEP